MKRQREFMEKGVAYLKPLTMAQVAEWWAFTKPRSAAPFPAIHPDAPGRV